MLYVMLCYVMLCYVMLCYVMLCYVMLCYVMLCYVMLCYVNRYNIDSRKWELRKIVKICDIMIFTFNQWRSQGLPGWATRQPGGPI